MKTVHTYRPFFLIFLMMISPIVLRAQLQVPGKPLGHYSRMKASNVIYLLPPLDPLEIEARVQGGSDHYLKSYEFAIERPLSLIPESHGGWIEEEHFRIWRVHLISPGARSLGVIFDRFTLHEDVKVMLYDPHLEHVRGAYSALNNKPSGILAIGHIPGEEVIIELQVPGHLDHYGELSIGSVSHAFLDAGGRGSQSACSGEFGCSQPCEIDVNCVEGADWQLAKRSVVRINTPTQYCTGVLLNNTAYDGDPLLLTAKHCIEKNSDAASTVFDFNYESPSCYGGDGSLDMSISGAKLLAVGDSIDFSLVRLSVEPPGSFDAYYAGWDLENRQSRLTTTIHHPEGDVKKISSDEQVPSSPTSPDDIPPDFKEFLYYSFWWIKEWDSGITEAGSSGAPLFNAENQVIGILSWGYTVSCGDSIGYDPGHERIIYGKAGIINDHFTKIGVAWDHNEEAALSLEPWLDPAGSGVSAIGGYHPGAVTPLPQTPGRKFRVYPNPAGASLYITGEPGQTGMVVYNLYGLSGALQRSGKGLMPGPVQIGTGAIDPGIYLLQIISGSRSEAHKVVIVH
ncbi:MAG: trypsin-like peptidase domain-containing protein [Bacteroidota bacterium]